MDDVEKLFSFVPLHQNKQMSMRIRMKTPEMLYQQLDRITDFRFCQRDKYTEEERKILVAWGKKMHKIVKRYIFNIYAIAGVEDELKCDFKRSNDIYYHYYVSTEEYMNYKRG